MNARRDSVIWRNPTPFRAAEAALAAEAAEGCEAVGAVPRTIGAAGEGAILARNAPWTQEEIDYIKWIIESPKDNLSKADQIKNALVQRLMDRGYSAEEIIEWLNQSNWKNGL